MKRCLKIMLAVMLVMTMIIPTLAVNAATVTTNKGYVLVEEDFESFGATEQMNYSTMTTETEYPIGGENTKWVLQTNSGKIFNYTNAFITNSGTETSPNMALSLSSGGLVFESDITRRSAVYYNGDYSKVGNNFKISFNFKKSTIKLGTAVKFMLSDDIKSYYALNFEGKADRPVWNLYKVTNNGTPEVLVSSPETISITSGTNFNAVNNGSVTIVYDNGKISWEIDANRYSLGAYKHTGTYTDATPFSAKPSECKFGFSTDTGNSATTLASFDNIKFSYSVSNISEDFSGEGITKDTAFANESGVQSVRTNITGTDLYVTTRRVSNVGRLIAKVDSTENKLNISYTNASMFNINQVNKLDFVEYRGSDFEGVGENYTISFDYTSGQSANAGYFIFGLENNGEEDFEYNDYYVLAFSGKGEVANHINNNEYTIPGWEIRKMTGGDTWSDTIVSSDYTITHDPNAEGASVDNTIKGTSIKEASVILTVNNGVATVTVDHAKDDGTPDVKTFNITPKGNRFGFSHGGTFAGSESASPHSIDFDNIVLTANKKAVEPIDGKVYVYGGKFAQKAGMLLFEVPNGNNVSYHTAPITLTTHEQATANIPEGASKVFFWNNFENIYPLNPSVEITQ
ncbi:MAG: hypothetical protein E7404_03805 [Ruminococcaceae bacterium]|nr:hypothetical protein [Oscillospiraceae bacterium]